MKIVEGNIFDSGADAIIHQVNCRGVMGSGVAKQVKDRYPDVYKAYKARCEMHQIVERVSPGSSDLLGTAMMCFVYDKEQYIVNMFAQDEYGYGGCYTDYDALRDCLREVNRKFAGQTVAVPYMISCCRGGGDWSVVSEMIEEELKDCDVTVYKYSG